MAAKDRKNEHSTTFKDLKDIDSTKITCKC